MTDPSASEKPTVSELLARDPLRRLAAMARGKSGADIEQLVRQARQQARHQARTLTYDDLEQYSFRTLRITNRVCDTRYPSTKRGTRSCILTSPL